MGKIKKSPFVGLFFIKFSQSKESGMRIFAFIACIGIAGMWIQGCESSSVTTPGGGKAPPVATGENGSDFADTPNNFRNVFGGGPNLGTSGNLGSRAGTAQTGSGAGAPGPDGTAEQRLPTTGTSDETNGDQMP